MISEIGRAMVQMFFLRNSGLVFLGERPLPVLEAVETAPKRLRSTRRQRPSLKSFPVTTKTDLAHHRISEFPTIALEHLAEIAQMETDAAIRITA
jgi:hypothetical protein